jgi:hypothetical protein
MMTELHWIEGPWPGKPAVSARPRAGDWLEDELAGWRECGVDEVVSLLTPDEVESLELQDQGVLSRRLGLGYRSFPIVDRSVPSSGTETVRLIEAVDAGLSAGKNVVIHCRQGVGRSSLIAASLLVWRGMQAQEAFERVGRARGVAVPETEEQREWVEKLAAELAAHRLVKESR